ncbi:MAG: ATP-dependent Clp protease adaptor ClpS [Polyangiaceae bacterium]
MARLTPELALAVQEACAEARRCRHREVDAAHVIRALLRLPVVLGTLSVRGVSVALVNEELEARLAGLPAVTSYRDGAEVALSAPVEAAMRGSMVLRWIRPLSALAMFDALTGAEKMREVVARSRFDQAPVDGIARAALAAAQARGHRNVLVEHALYALLDAPAVANAIRHLGRDVGEVRKRLDERLQLVVSKRLAERNSLVAFTSLRANLTGARALAPDGIAVNLIREHLGATLAALGLPAFDLLYAVVHGRPLDDALVDASRVEVWLHDDDHTTMEAVVQVLEEAFGAKHAEAEASMRRIHLEGRAAIGCFAREDARARLAVARAFCRDRMMPLRIDTLPAAED